MDATPLLQVTSCFLLNAALAWMAGTLCARRWRGIPGAGRSFERAAVVCAAAVAGSAWAAAAAMADQPLALAGGAFATMLGETDYGHAALAACACTVGAGAAARWLPVRFQRGSCAVLLGALVFSRASISHAGEHGVASVQVAVECAHLACAAVWTGIAGVSAFAVLRSGMPADGAGAYLDRMSRGAAWALAGVVAAGLYNAWDRMGGLADFAGTVYGQVLSVKLALVALAALLGAYNRFAGLPAFARGEPAFGRILAVLRVETALLLAVLLSAAVLVNQPPPVQMAGAYPMTIVPAGTRAAASGVGPTFL